MDDIVISRSDGLYMGYHLATLKISHIDFIFPTLGITRIKNGSGIWRIGTEYANVKKGDYVFLNNLEYRRIQSGEIECECYWFNAPLLSFIGNDECSRVFYGKGKNHTHILRGDTLDDIFDRIRIEITNKQSFTLLAALTIEFICAAEREYANISDSLSDYNPRESSSAERINHSISYINEHLGDELNIQLLASEVNMSRSHYTRSFIKFVTIPPSEYIIRCRIGKFLSRIRDNIGILELAMECGFTSVSGFYKSFRKICGCNPSEYLVQLRKLQ